MIQRKLGNRYDDYDIEGRRMGFGKESKPNGRGYPDLTASVFNGSTWTVSMSGQIGKAWIRIICFERHQSSQ
jgi:hypothetical protein